MVTWPRAVSPNNFATYENWRKLIRQKLRMDGPGRELGPHVFRDEDWKFRNVDWDFCAHTCGEIRSRAAFLAMGGSPERAHLAGIDHFVRICRPYVFTGQQGLNSCLCLTGRLQWYVHTGGGHRGSDIDGDRDGLCGDRETGGEVKIASRA